MASCQFMEKLLVQCVVLLPVSRGHEDVATDVLVYDLTICRHTAEGHVHVTVELDGNLEFKARVRARTKTRGRELLYFFLNDEAKHMQKLETEQHTCLMSQLTFHCLIVLYLHVFTTSSTFMSMRIRRLLAIPRTSSLRPPLNL